VQDKRGEAHEFAAKSIDFALKEGIRMRLAESLLLFVVKLGAVKSSNKG
jgi:hypothetical protein